MALYEVGRLDEHPAGPAGGVVDLAVVWLNDLDDELDDRGWREELAALVALGERELAEEVLVDEPEPVTLDRARHAAEQAQEFDKDSIREPGVGARQDPVEIRVRLFDGRHGVVDPLAEVRSLGQSNEAVKARLVREVEHSARVVVSGADLATTGALPLELIAGGGEPKVGVAQENEPEDGGGVLRRAQPRVSTQLIGGLPQPVLQLT